MSHGFCCGQLGAKSVIQFFADDYDFYLFEALRSCTLLSFQFFYSWFFLKIIGSQVTSPSDRDSASSC